MPIGSVELRVVSETHALRAAVARELGDVGDDAEAPIALLLGQPAAGSSVGSPTWILYESGDIVLRRSRVVDEVLSAACYHLASLRAAVASPLLPLRLRPILHGDGSATLVTPAPIHTLTGSDRRLAARGCQVLPTTISLVDSETLDLVLAEESSDAVASGRYPIRAVLVSDRNEVQLEGVAPILSLARHVVRTPDRNLQGALDQVGRLTRDDAQLVRVLADDAIMEFVHDLGDPSE